jgi:hypothetical protein
MFRDHSFVGSTSNPGMITSTTSNGSASGSKSLPRSSRSILAVMSNHIHIVLRDRPDLAREWSFPESPTPIRSVFTLEAKTEQDRRRVHVRSGLMRADRPCASGVSARDNRRHPSQAPERNWRVSDFSPNEIGGSLTSYQPHTSTGRAGGGQRPRRGGAGSPGRRHRRVLAPGR